MSQMTAERTPGNNQASAGSEGTRSRVLCIDLDGTLVKTDTLHEALVSLLKRQPLMLFRLPGWIRLGRAGFKQKLAALVPTDASLLPYDLEILGLIDQARSNGIKTCLVTGSDERVANAVAGYLGVFDEVFGSDGVNNLSGTGKAEFLERHYGRGCFTYAGNAQVDMVVWKSGGHAIVCNNSDSFCRKVETLAKVEAVIHPSGSFAGNALRALRPHQWLKNLLVLVPLLTSHQLFAVRPMFHAMLAFAAFCCTASAVYICNDILDLDADRAHPRKKDRPWAAGELQIASAPMMIFALLLAAAGFSLRLPAGFSWILLLYLLLTLAYSLWLKRCMLVDVFVLAALYTIRLMGGGEASGIFLTPWLLIFSMFMFLSLALVKRYSEVYSVCNEEKAVIKGRGYLAADLDQLAVLGTSSGFLSVLVFALYVTSPEVKQLYHEPVLLLLACPLILYWVSRVWIIARRGNMHDDPVLFALRDRISYLAAFGVAFIMLLAKFLHS